MTSRERFMTALQRGEPDRVPVFLRDLTLGLDVADLSTRTVCCGGPGGGYHGEYSARAVVACQERFGHDCVVGSVQDLGLDTEALGGAVDIPVNGVPRVARPAFADKAVLSKARIPRMDRDGRMPGILEAYQRVRAALGDRVAVAANVEGPVTKAGILRGFEALMVDMIDAPAFVERLVRFATDVSIAHLHQLAQTGVDLAFVAAAADGPAMISPEAYRRYTLPNLTRIVAACRDLCLPVVFHPHGVFTEPRFHDLVTAAAETGIAGFQFGESCDLSVAKDLWGTRVAILGGTDVPTVLSPGPASEIRADASRHLAGAAPGGGYIFMPSCSLHRGLPLKHVETMVATVREWRPSPSRNTH